MGDILISSIPSIVTVLRLIMAASAAILGLGWPVTSVILLILSAALDVVDGWLARLLGAASTVGAVLDLMVDGAMWGCLYYLALVVAEPRGKVCFVLLMTLEWATSCTVLVSFFPSVSSPSGSSSSHWKEVFAEPAACHWTDTLLRWYFRDRMKNPWAALGNLSHLILPLALFARRALAADDPRDTAAGGPPAIASASASTAHWWLGWVAVAAVPGVVLYVFVTGKILSIHVSTWWCWWFAGTAGTTDGGRQRRRRRPPLPAHLIPLAAYHALTAPLVGLLVQPLSSVGTGPQGRPSVRTGPLATFIAERAITSVLVAAHAVTDQAAMHPHPAPPRRAGGARWGAALWAVSFAWSTAIMWQAGYWEVGGLIPALHGERFLTDMTVDQAVIAAEEAVFGVEPASGAGLRALLGAKRGTVSWEAWHLLYVSFMPCLVLVTAAFTLCPALAAPGRREEQHQHQHQDQHQDHQRRRHGRLGNGVVAKVTATFTICWLSYLCIPVYGPVITLGPAEPPARAMGNTTTSVANKVWALGRAHASTGTALPSSHCAITAAMALAVGSAAAGGHAARRRGGGDRCRRGGCYCVCRSPGQSTAPSVAPLPLAEPPPPPPPIPLYLLPVLVHATRLYALLIGVAVVVCGFHYVTDVAAGWAVAALCCFALGRE